MSYSSPSGSRNLPADEARDREPHRAIGLDRRHAEERGLLGVDAKVEVGALQAHRVHHVARAGHARDQRLDLAREQAQRLDVRADHADLDRRGDGRAVLELVHADAGAGISRERRRAGRRAGGWRAPARSPRSRRRPRRRSRRHCATARCSRCAGSRGRGSRTTSGCPASSRASRRRSAARGRSPRGSRRPAPRCARGTAGCPRSGTG